MLLRTTNLGYGMFRCKVCRRTYNERSDTPFNFEEVPTDIIFQVLLSRVRYKLSYRDVAEFFLLRGFEFTHETVRDWEVKFLPHLDPASNTRSIWRSLFEAFPFVAKYLLFLLPDKRERSPMSPSL